MTQPGPTAETSPITGKPAKKSVSTLIAQVQAIVDETAAEKSCVTKSANQNARKKSASNATPTHPADQSTSSSDDENLAQLRARIQKRKNMRKKLKLDEVVTKLRESQSELSSETESLAETARKASHDNIKGLPKQRSPSKIGSVTSLATSKGSASEGSSSDTLLRIDFSNNAIKRRVRRNEVSYAYL